jgi:uncharacterized RDD family membrane protein YckC
MSVAPHAEAATVSRTRATTSYAGIVTRAVAFALDVAILYGVLFLVGTVVALIIGAFTNFNLDGDLETILGAAAIWIVASFIYCIAFWSLAGQTPGARLLGIEVLRCEGGHLSAWRSFVRMVGVILAAIPLFAGYLPILLRDDRRGLHDLIAGSEVRYTEKKRPPRPLRGRG